MSIPTLRSNNADALTDRQKADCLADQYESVHNSLPDITPRHRHITEFIHDHLQHPVDMDARTKRKLLTTPGEVTAALKRLPLNKAPGPDGLDNILLKNLPRKAVVQLMYILNASLILQYFPLAWRHALIVPIPKPGKDPSLPSSYRRISVLNSLSKVAERIILVRVDNLDRAKRLTPSFLFGFRPLFSPRM